MALRKLQGGVESLVIEPTVPRGQIEVEYALIVAARRRSERDVRLLLGSRS